MDHLLRGNRRVYQFCLICRQRPKDFTEVSFRPRRIARSRGQRFQRDLIEALSGLFSPATQNQIDMLRNVSNSVLPRCIRFHRCIVYIVRLYERLQLDFGGE